MRTFQETAVSGYSGAVKTVSTPRQIEYNAIGKITRDLQFAITKNSSDKRPLAQAIHTNREMWSLLATHVADDANELPVDLRARLFSLAEFVRQHSGKVLNGTESGLALLDINLSIMQGLSGEPNE